MHSKAPTELSNEKAFSLCQRIANQQPGWENAFRELFAVYHYIFGQRPVKQAIGSAYPDPRWQRVLQNHDVATPTGIATYYFEWLMEKGWRPLGEYDASQASFAYWLRRSVIYALLNLRHIIQRERATHEAAAVDDNFTGCPDACGALPDRLQATPPHLQGVEAMDIANRVLDHCEFAIFYGSYYIGLSDHTLAAVHQLRPEYLNEAKGIILMKLGAAFFQHAASRRFIADEISYASCNERSLGGLSFPVLMLDVVALEDLHVVVASGIDTEGQWHALSVEGYPVLTEKEWDQTLRSLKARGLLGVHLVIAYHYPGLEAALTAHYAAVTWQCCQQRLKHLIWKQTPPGQRSVAQQGLNKIFDRENTASAALHHARELEAKLKGSPLPALATMLSNPGRAFANLRFARSLRLRLSTTWTTHALPRRMPNLQVPYREDYADFLTWKLQGQSFSARREVRRQVEAWVMGYQAACTLSKQSYIKHRTALQELGTPAT